MSSVSRSSSLTSVEDAEPRKSRQSASRRRFTNIQIMMLDNMYRHNPRPSRQERETLSKAGQMDLKSVTIWFQNKRQSERKMTLNVQEEKQYQDKRERGYNGKHPTSQSHPSLSPESQKSSSSPRLYPLPPSPPVQYSSSLPMAVRPSLERVASRSELVQPFEEPQTPKRQRTRDPRVPIWESMPESPLRNVDSPPARDFVEFGKFKRSITLEWACARRRLAEKEGEAATIDEEAEEDDEVDKIMQQKARALEAKVFLPSHHQLRLDGAGRSTAGTKRKLERAATWDAADARKPSTAPREPSSLRRSDTFSHSQPKPTPAPSHQDDDIMRAALALCGLGRGRVETE